MLVKGTHKLWKSHSICLWLLWAFRNSSALPVTVMVEVEKANFALCTLQAGKIPQQPLDYAFTEGEEITFYSEGPGEVHLTGEIALYKILL